MTNTILTNLGKSKLQNALGGESVSFKTLKISSASNFDENTLDLTDVVHTQAINNIQKVPDGILVENIIHEKDGGFKIATLGFYDKENNLLVIAKVPETFKYTLESGNGSRFTYRTKIALTNSDNIVLESETNTNLVTRAFVDEKLNEIEQKYKDINGFDYKQNGHPFTNTNPTNKNAVWLDTSNGEIFVCEDNTRNKNFWRGSKGRVVGQLNVSLGEWTNISKFPKEVYDNFYFTFEGFSVPANIPTIGDVNININYVNAGSDLDNLVRIIKDFNTITANKTVVKFEFPEVQTNTERKFSIVASIRTGNDSNGASNIYSKTYEVTIIQKPKVSANIPMPGEYGFGCCVNHSAASEFGLIPMDGCTNPKSENFGNYQDTKGNIFVCVPRFFYKWNVDFSDVTFQQYHTDDFEVPGVFQKSDGTTADCIFVTKYFLGNSEGVDNTLGVACSKKGVECLSLEKPKEGQKYNSIYNLNGSGVSAENHDECGWSACRTLNGNAVPLHFGMYMVFLLYWEAHYNACIKKYSNLESIPSDLMFMVNGKPGCYDEFSEPLKGKTTQFLNFMTGTLDNEKVSHNGQKCGVVDVWDFGYTALGGGYPYYEDSKNKLKVVKFIDDYVKCKKHYKNDDLETQRPFNYITSCFGYRDGDNFGCDRNFYDVGETGNTDRMFKIFKVSKPSDYIYYWYSNYRYVDENNLLFFKNTEVSTNSYYAGKNQSSVYRNQTLIKGLTSFGNNYYQGYSTSYDDRNLYTSTHLRAMMVPGLRK